MFLGFGAGVGFFEAGTRSGAMALWSVWGSERAE